MARGGVGSPRHLLVPRAYQQDGTGAWAEFDTGAALEQAYSPETLVTALETIGDNRLPISSSTKPDLMVRMLEILDVRGGQRVLEIGTGTGYNAALLAHRLGDDRVFSVDVVDDLVDLARKRLDAAGYRPTLVAADGVHGLAEHAPFDRIIATCSVPALPWQWVEQLAPGGAILVDLTAALPAERRDMPCHVGRLPVHHGDPFGRGGVLAFRWSAGGPEWFLAGSGSCGAHRECVGAP